jgi:hypothetical protein
MVFSRLTTKMFFFWASENIGSKCLAFKTEVAA